MMITICDCVLRTSVCSSYASVSDQYHPVTNSTTEDVKSWSLFMPIYATYISILLISCVYHFCLASSVTSRHWQLSLSHISKVHKRKFLHMMQDATQVCKKPKLVLGIRFTLTFWDIITSLHHAAITLHNSFFFS